MFRSVYFLSLLLNVRFIFCYDYIPKHSRDLKNIHKRFKNEIDEGRVLINDLEKYDTAYDKESMANIDVASFIQNPVNDQISYNQDDESLSMRKEYKDYQSLDDIFDNKANAPKDYDGLESGTTYKIKPDVPRNTNFDDLILDNPNSGHAKNSRTYKMDNSIHTNTNHYPQKKCALKNMKIPFFSHNVGSSKTKKNKKRKLFGSRNTKKLSTNVAKVTESSSDNKNMNKETTLESQAMYKIKKRSYIERLCPICKRRFFDKYYDQKNKRRDDSKIIHNSRQYYQTTESNEKPNLDVHRPHDKAGGVNIPDIEDSLKI